MRLTLKHLVIACITSVGMFACSAPSEPGSEATQETVALELTYSPEIIQLPSGRVTRLDPVTWRGEATARGGRIDSVRRAPARSGLAAVQSYTVPDSTVQQMLPYMEFTSGPNPNYVALYTGQAADTMSETVDGVVWTTIHKWGNLGQPTMVTARRNGADFFQIRYTWVTVDGGVQASQAITEDWSQPELLVRTTITVVQSRVTILT